MAHTENVLKTRINQFGREINDPNPKFPDFSEKSGEDSLLERMRGMVRNEMSIIAGQNNMETFEEANDFDIDDPFEMDVQETRYMREEYVNVTGAPNESKSDSPPTQAMGEGEIVQPEANGEAENEKKPED